MALERAPRLAARLLAAALGRPEAEQEAGGGCSGGGGSGEQARLQHRPAALPPFSLVEVATEATGWLLRLLGGGALNRECLRLGSATGAAGAGAFVLRPGRTMRAWPKLVWDLHNTHVHCTWIALPPLRRGVLAGQPGLLPVLLRGGGRGGGLLGRRGRQLAASAAPAAVGAGAGAGAGVRRRRRHGSPRPARGLTRALPPSGLLLRCRNSSSSTLVLSVQFIVHPGRKQTWGGKGVRTECRCSGNFDWHSAQGVGWSVCHHAAVDLLVHASPYWSPA